MLFELEIAFSELSEAKLQGYSQQKSASFYDILTILTSVVTIQVIGQLYFSTIIGYIYCSTIMEIVTKAFSES